MLNPLNVFFIYIYFIWHLFFCDWISQISDKCVTFQSKICALHNVYRYTKWAKKNQFPPKGYFQCTNVFPHEDFYRNKQKYLSLLLSTIQRVKSKKCIWASIFVFVFFTLSMPSCSQIQAMVSFSSIKTPPKGH